MQRPSTALGRSTDTQAALGTDAFEELRSGLVRRVLRNQFAAERGLATQSTYERVPGYAASRADQIGSRHGRSSTR
jgi:hypothetical protein